MVPMRLAAAPAALLLAAATVASGSFALAPGDGGVASGGASGASQLEQDAPGVERAQDMGFFITSVGIGRGGDLGGLEGGDAHCQALAEGVGAGDRTWHAYLSTQETDRAPAVDARNRIGHGPWHNAEGLLIASDVDDLHYNNANIRYEYALNERGERVNSGAMGDSPSLHDILTGTRMDGTAFPPGEDRTCSNWTSSGEGSAFIGHHDRFTFETPGSSWNTAHGSRGCSQDDLVATGGAGLFYCFAVD